MTANKKILSRRGCFSDRSKSWSLWGSFSDFVFKRHNASFPRKSTGETASSLKKVSKRQHIRSILIKQVRKKFAQAATSKSVRNISDSRKAEPDIKREIVELISTAKDVKKAHNNLKLESSQKYPGCSLNTEAQAGSFVKTKKQGKRDSIYSLVPVNAAVPTAKKGSKRLHLKLECPRSVVAKEHHRRQVFRKKSFGILWLRKCFNLLMMPRKSSPFTGRNRLHSHKLGARKSLKILDLWLWFYKRFWKCRKNLKNNFEKVYSYLKLKIRRPTKAVRRTYDMNNNTSGILCEIQPRTNTCLRDETVKLQRVESETPFSNVASNRPLALCMGAQWSSEDTLQRKLSDVPLIKSYPDDMCMLLTEKEVSISSQEEGDVQGDQDDETVFLTPDKIKPCTSDNVDFQDNTEGMENGDDSCSMEVDENSSSDVFNTKLLDHPYCKSPLQETLLEDGLDISARQGLKNGLKIISNVTDEQLVSSLCGIYNLNILTFPTFISYCFSKFFSLNKAIKQTVLQFR